MALSSGVSRRITRGADGREVRAQLGGPPPPNSQGMATTGGLQPPAFRPEGRGGLSSLGPQFALGGASQGGPPPPNSQGRITAGLSGAQQVGVGANPGGTQADALARLRQVSPGNNVPLGRGELQAFGGPPPPNSLGMDTGPVNTPLRPQGPTQQFGPGSNLIGTQFNPDPSSRLQGIQGQVDTARNAVAGFQPGQFQGIAAGTGGGLTQARRNVNQATVGPFGDIGAGQFGSQGDTAAARAGISQDLGALRGGPSRSQLAADTFDLIQQRGAPQFQRELRGVGQKAASLGRIGAGVTTNELTDVFSQRQRDLDLTKRGLSLEAAGLERGDLLNTLGASQGVAGQLFGQDIGEAGFQQGLRGEERGERGFFAGQAGDEAQRALQRAGMFAGIQGQEFGQEQGLRQEARGERGAEQDFNLRNLGAQQNVFGQLRGAEGQQFGQEQSQRNELRGERGFQEGLDRRAVQERVQQRALEEALLQGQFGRDFDRDRLRAQIGFGGGAQANFGNQAGQFSQSFGNQANASNQAAADVVASSFANRGGGPQFPQPQFPQPTGRTGLGNFTERRPQDFNPRL